MEVCRNITRSVLVFWMFNLVNPMNFSETVDTSSFQNLHQLYQEYCDNTSFVTDDAMLSHFIPCCIPCSCLPTCQSMQKYCPVEVDKPGEELTDQNFNFKKDNNESLLFTTKPSLLNNLNGSSNRRINSANSNMNQEKHTLLNDELNLGDAFLDNSGTNISRVGEDLIECVRPQTYYHINSNIDSQAYKMVISCPVEFLGISTKEKCDLRFRNEYLGDMIPVTSSLTGISYINKHCLICNEHNDDKNISFVMWQPKLVARTRAFRILFIKSRLTLLRDFELHSNIGTNLIFAPPSLASTSRCLAMDITTCNQTDLWKDYDNVIEEMCNSGTIKPVVHMIDRQSMLFKNLACVICNGGRTVLNCGYSVKHIQDRSVLSIFSLTLNMQTLNWDDSSNMSEIIPLSHINSPKLTYLSAGVCVEGYVNLMNRCRKIYCPKDQVMNNDHCVPLYETLSGLKLHLKLKVTVSQAIDNQLRSSFADALKYLLNDFMEQKTTLSLAEISVWYLPRSTNNPQEYYILNMYLFNSSNEIIYDSGMREIYEFLQILKTKSSLTLADDVTIQLGYGFAPQIIARYQLTDMSINNGIQLISLMENGWKPIRPGPVLLVSDSNWCYRIDLDMNEVEYHGTQALKLKETGAIIYREQYDADSEIRLCIDYIDIDREEKVTVIDNDVIVDPTDDVKSLNSWYLSESAMLTWCVIGLILLCAAVNKVRHWTATKHLNTRQSDIENIEINASENGIQDQNDAQNEN